jgi:kynurenine formamidase
MQLSHYISKNKFEIESRDMKKAALKVFDLTHTLSAKTPCWDGDCGFHLTIETDYKDCSGPDHFRKQKIVSRAGIGTHMDAPAHCFAGAKTIDTLALADLVTDCTVIKVNDVADENYVIMPEVVEKFEKSNGKLNVNTFVIFYTGWDRYWNDPERYRNNLKFPSVHESTARLLLERGISGLGTDTLSADAQSNAFPVHRAILGAGKYLVEDIANANDLPSIGTTIFVLPIKLKDGTEALIRLIATL